MSMEDVRCAAEPSHQEEAEGVKQSSWLVAEWRTESTLWVPSENFEDWEQSYSLTGAIRRCRTQIHWNITKVAGPHPFFPSCVALAAWFCVVLSLQAECPIRYEAGPRRPSPSQAPSFPPTRPLGSSFSFSLSSLYFFSPSLSLFEFSHPTRGIRSLYHVHLGKPVTLSSKPIRSSPFCVQPITKARDWLAVEMYVRYALELRTASLVTIVGELDSWQRVHGRAFIALLSAT